MPLINQLTELLSAVKTKSSGTISIDLSGETLPPPNPTFTVSYDFTGANDVEVIALFGGHDHEDSFINTTEASGITPNTHGINVFGIRCQQMKEIRWNVTHDRMPYTDTQNCFNMISVDTVAKKLYVYRYGVDDGIYGAEIFDY